jgi:hypothetical protein
VGVYSQTWASSISQGGLSKLVFTVMRQSIMNFVELLWTLMGHSLGQSEDQVRMISYLYFIPFVDIPGSLPYFSPFLCKHFWVKQSYQGRQDFFRCKSFSTVSLWFILTVFLCFCHTGLIRVVSYPPKVKA